MTPASHLGQRGRLGAGGGTEPGMAELAARTLWVFTSCLYLGQRMESQRIGIA